MFSVPWDIKLIVKIVAAVEFLKERGCSHESLFVGRNEIGAPMALEDVVKYAVVDDV